MKDIFVFITVSLIAVVVLGWIFIEPTYDDSALVTAAVEEQKTETVVGPSVIFTDLGVPTDIDTSFKTYMDWRTVTDKSSSQYKLVNTYGWHDDDGFMRVTSERDLGITQDYYMIALGSYYGTTIGTKYRITTTEGNVFYGILSDCKADKHTNSTHQYARNKDVVEFLVDTRYLNADVKHRGSADILKPLSGAIAKIERIDIN